MRDLNIVVQFEQDHAGFRCGPPYHALALEAGKFLLINDDAQFTWVEASLLTPVTIDAGGDRLFDLEIHRFRRKLEKLAGKRVVFTTWENIGFDPDEVTPENMFLYRGTVESYDGETLFLKRNDDENSRFGILPKSIATLDEA